MTRQRRVVALVGMDELDPNVLEHAVAIAARWVYFEPPRIIFEPKKRPSLFLTTDSNRLSKTPIR